MDISPYTISVPDKGLSDLQQRLSIADLPDQLQGPDQWAFGTPVPEVQKLIKHWREKFHWRKAEADLNTLPHFKTTVSVSNFDNISLHFIHQPSPSANAIPLLFCHGWPGSFLEVKKLLPLLQGSATTPAFHVVAPSLPNFGFSSGVSKSGFGLAQYAEALHSLMLKLGYTHYATQAGDWGFAVTRAIGLLYPSHCTASHLNLILASPPQFASQPLLALHHAITPYTPRERVGLARSHWFDSVSFGYNLLQSTKPQTVSIALSSSPVALLAWMLEKLHDWSDAYPWSDDEILTWVCIYWFSDAGPGASVRIYYEAQHPDNVELALRLRRWVPGVKLGLAHFPREISCVPCAWGETLGEVVLQSVHESGGHFAAWERPEAVVRDLGRMFGRRGKCVGVVGGMSGFDD